MRDYRAWDIDYQYMLYEDAEHSLIQKFYDDGYIFEQWIGLRDIFGVKIYEGDFVYKSCCVDQNECNCHTFSSSESPVVFVPTECAYWGAYGRITAKTIKKNNIRVLGNIHEHPELLPFNEGRKL